MRSMVWLFLVVVPLVWGPGATEAQDLRQLFRNVSPSVTVIRARGHDVTAAGQVRFSETVEGQSSHLVRFLATGGDSPAVRAELRTIETTLEGRRAEWATIEKASALHRRGCTPRGS